MAVFNPKFLYRNSITAASQLSDSAGTSTANLTKLFDRNDELQYASIGATSGTRTITWTPSAATAITRIYLQNINWATFTVKYDTSSDFSSAISLSGNTKTNLYFEFNSVSVTNVVFSVTATITSGEAIKAGQIYVGRELFEMAAATAGTQRISPLPAQKIVQLSDGTTYKIFVRKSRNFDINLVGVTTTERDNYSVLYDLNRREPFVFIPEPATSSDAWNGIATHVNWINGFDFENYSGDISINGYNGVIQLATASGV